MKVNHDRVMPRIIRRGFTLIELLVVIGIIALLMAILLPALSRARQEAQKITCAGNLRQWGGAMSTYAHDNDNHFPDNLGAHSNILHLNRAASGLVEFRDHFIRPYLWEGFPEFSEVTPSNVVTHCPVSTQRSQHTSFIRLGYNYLPHAQEHSAHTYFVSPRWFTKRRFDDRARHAPTMTDIYYTSDGSISASHWRDEDTVTGCNFLFEDARVDWFNEEEIEPAFNASGPGGQDRVALIRIPIPGLTAN